MKPSIEAIEFHGIEALRLHGPRGATAVISKLGAQVLSWIPPDGKERLFLSDKAIFDGSVAIRGGVPVCFPQFAQLGDLPKHGFVRTRAWSLVAQRTADDYALVTFELGSDDKTMALWPHAFHAELTLMLEGDRIDMEFVSPTPVARRLNLPGHCTATCVSSMSRRSRWKVWPGTIIVMPLMVGWSPAKKLWNWWLKARLTASPQREGTAGPA
jgi:hypothetical protein